MLLIASLALGVSPQPARAEEAAAGSTLARYPSLYVVTWVDGHCGVQARSSYAP